ncbi:MAG TPA: polysaccharide biosynthesis C-terminal domain-containing protein, partial [Intrasporangium sp.]|uniref:lipopolysaccharide biosynthesis protein n=1 Tax=Intrasporangium sp. TaxID=1925024 RepID=UPI002D779FBC
LLVVAALLLGGSLAWAGAGWAVVYLPSAAVAVWWLRKLARRMGAAPPDPAPGGPEPAVGSAEPVGRAFWRFSSARALTSILQMAMQRLDIVLVGALAGAGAAAVYTAASRFVVVGQTLGTALGNASDPRIAASMASGNTGAVREIYQASTAWFVALTWPMFLLLVVLREPLLAIFGPDYGSAGPALVVLSLAMLLSTAFGTVDSVIVMAGHTGWNLVNAVLAAAVMFGLDLLLIPAWGVLGAAIGWASAIVVRNVVGLGQVRLALRLHPFGRATLLTVALNLVAFLGIPMAFRALLGDGLPDLVVGCAVAVVLYAGGLWSLREPLQLGALISFPGGRDRG